MIVAWTRGSTYYGVGAFRPPGGFAGAYVPEPETRPGAAGSVRGATWHPAMAAAAWRAEEEHTALWISGML